MDAAASSGAASSGAGITRRKHLEEISDEELLDGGEILDLSLSELYKLVNTYDISVSGIVFIQIVDIYQF